MPDVTEMVETGAKNTENPWLNPDPWIPRDMRGAAYSTGLKESPSKSNEGVYCTKSENQREFTMILSITSIPPEESDLVQALSLSEAADIAKKFINDLPDDTIDVDLGPGL
jgi:hypothetical protein